MKKFDLAASMNDTMNSSEFKDLFSSAATIQKMAFNKVSDENVPSEVETQVETSLNVEPVPVVTAPTVARDNSDGLAKTAGQTLIKASEELEAAGFASLARYSLLLVDRLIVEAKKKKAPKKSDKKDSKSDKDKKDSKKSTKSDKKDTKSDKKDSKSTKTTKKAQAQNPVASLRATLFNNLKAALPTELAGKVKWGQFDLNHDMDGNTTFDGKFKVLPEDKQAVTDFLAKQATGKSLMRYLSDTLKTLNPKLVINSLIEVT